MFGRYLPATVFLGAGAFVFWYNDAYIDSTLVLPYLDKLWPPAKQDLELQGNITAVALLVVGALFLFRAVWATVTQPKDQRYS